MPSFAKLMLPRFRVPKKASRACTAPRPARLRSAPPDDAHSKSSSWHVFSSCRLAMADDFLALDDPVHRLLRALARLVPLVPCFGAGGFPTLAYRVEPGDLPEHYFSLAAFHAQQGLPAAKALNGRWRVHPMQKAVLPAEVGFFDAVRLDRRCCRDLRLKLDPFGPGMVSSELLAFGTGMLRACNDNPQEQIHRYLWSAHGQLHSP